jgi:hypothetical protein
MPDISRGYGCPETISADSLPVAISICEYADVFLDKLPGMPPDRDIEFSIEL